jgi:acetolactate synthase-1/2/3 large subunit
MRANDGSRTGGEILVDQLIAHGVQHVFCVPGESYLAALDAFHDRQVKITVCRQEGGAAMMAEAHGKATGRPGICFVTRGPGATNASPGIHIAKQDSTPMIMFVGQIAREMREREAFQEVDYRAVFGSMTKWTTEIDDPARIPELVSRAFYTATAGRPGPVVIALPEDMLTERVVVPDAPAFEPVETWPGLTDMARLQKLLWAAKKPVAIVGGSRWSEKACAAMARFAERFSLPVINSFRRGHLFDQTHACYAGDLGVGPNPKIVARIKDADLLLLIGGRLSEMPSQGYLLIDIPGPKQTLVHVHPGAEELGRVYHPHLAINASPTAFAAALEGLQAPASLPWAEDTRSGHADYLAFSEKPTQVPGKVNVGEIMVWLRGQLAPEDIICNGAGNFSAWIHRFYRFRKFATLYGTDFRLDGLRRPRRDRDEAALPGAHGLLPRRRRRLPDERAGIRHRRAIRTAGDRRHRRQRHVRHHPHASGARLSRPRGRDRAKESDFAAYGRAFGGFGVLVEKTEDFPKAFQDAKASGKPAIIHLKVDPDAITPSTTLHAIRDKALKAGTR